MAIPIYQVDAFTEEPFKGNPGRRLPSREAGRGVLDAEASPPR